MGKAYSSDLRDRIVSDIALGRSRRSAFPPFWGEPELCREAGAARSCDGIDCPMNRTAFETYVETQLAPTINPGDVMILDNLSSHKSEKAKAIFKARGAWFLFTPPYSPDLNPIEMAFSKLKAHLRRTGARTIDALWQTIGNICDIYTPDECWNFLKASGYASD